MYQAALQAVRLYESFGDGRGLGHAFKGLSFSLWELDRPEEAVAAATRALVLLREHGGRPKEAASKL